MAEQGCGTRLRAPSPVTLTRAGAVGQPAERLGSRLEVSAPRGCFDQLRQKVWDEPELVRVIRRLLGERQRLFVAGIAVVEGRFRDSPEGQRHSLSSGEDPVSVVADQSKKVLLGGLVGRERHSPIRRRAHAGGLADGFYF